MNFLCAPHCSAGVKTSARVAEGAACVHSRSSRSVGSAHPPAPPREILHSPKPNPAALRGTHHCLGGGRKPLCSVSGHRNSGQTFSPIPLDLNHFARLCLSSGVTQVTNRATRGCYNIYGPRIPALGI